MWDTALGCKNCRSKNVHIVKVTTYQGPDDYTTNKVVTIDRSTVTVADDKFSMPNRVRAESLTVYLATHCEQCHSLGTVKFLFHKGTTYAENIYIGAADEN